jgi:hypothetical protein
VAEVSFSQVTGSSNGSKAWLAYRQSRPLLARRGVERLDGGAITTPVATSAAQAELEVKLTVPSCTHKHSWISERRKNV